MFYDASANIFRRACRLRKSMTDSEKMLWEQLRKNKMGVRFKSQHPVKYFIVDFYCHELKLAIELDGEIHDYQKEKDESRTDELENFGIMVIRFKNNQLEAMSKVLESIRQTIEARRQFLADNPNI